MRCTGGQRGVLGVCWTIVQQYIDGRGTSLNVEGLFTGSMFADHVVGRTRVLVSGKVAITSSK